MTDPRAAVHPPRRPEAWAVDEALLTERPGFGIELGPAKVEKQSPPEA